MARLLFLDCDSTLTSIEGVDELARIKGGAVFQESEALTHRAMNGEVPVEAVFARRLELIRPSFRDCLAVGARYVEAIEPTALDLVTAARARGWTPIILSGGFCPVIDPLARYLGITQVEAVPLFFNKNGDYAGFDSGYPTTRSGGKPEIIERFRQQANPEKIVMVGDGVSDLETQDAVDLFVGFGRYVAREQVKLKARAFVNTLSEVIPLLDL